VPAIKSVEQLQERLQAVSRFLDAMGATGPAKELRDVCVFLQPHRQKTLDQLVSPQPKDGIAAEIIKLYDRSGAPGLTPEEIDRVFAKPELKRLSVSDLKVLATKLDVATGKLKKDELIARMKVMVTNRAGTHARVNS
jgi:hypothetical protein